MALYCKFDGVDGESKDSNHDKWSDLFAFSQGIDRPGSGASGANRYRGVATLSDVVATKAYDKASPKLQEAICKGKVFAKVEIEETANYGGARSVFLKYELKNVIVTSFSLSASGSDDAIPTESFSLNFEEIKVTYTEYDSEGNKGGNVEYGWKVQEGKPA